MIEKFQYITHDIENFPHWEQAELVCQGGCKWIQLRIKNMSDIDTKSIAKKVQNICIKYNSIFIINDNVELAHAILADGVHLGKSDMSPADARRILGNNFIIGGTANTFEDIKILAEDGVDYIGLGPFRFTSTKEKLSPILGIEGYKNIMLQYIKYNISIPTIAIGGILPDDVPSLLQSGIYGIATSSAVYNSKDIIHATQQFLSKLA